MRKKEWLRLCVDKGNKKLHIVMQLCSNMWKYWVFSRWGCRCRNKSENYFFPIHSISNLFVHRSNKEKKEWKRGRENELPWGMMFGIPVRCYQSWAAAHLSTPHYFNLLAFHNKAQMQRHTQTHAHTQCKNTAPKVHKRTQASHSRSIL